MKERGGESREENTVSVLYERRLSITWSYSSMVRVTEKRERERTIEGGDERVREREKKKRRGERERGGRREIGRREGRRRMEGGEGSRKGDKFRVRQRERQEIGVGSLSIFSLSSVKPRPN